METNDWHDSHRQRVACNTGLEVFLIEAVTTLVVVDMCNHGADSLEQYPVP